MISYIEGAVIKTGAKFVVVKTCGIGYKINTSPDTLIKLKNKKEAALFTHLVVRENALDLYGFITEEELGFFEKLIQVSGVGPKTALGVIGVASVSNLKKGIAAGDISYLTKVSGIGKKTAEKIILELRDKFDKSEGVELKAETDAMEALWSLGYSQSEAREALKQVSTEISNTSARVKEALKILGGK